MANDSVAKVDRREIGDFPDIPGGATIYDVTMADGRIYRAFIPASVPLDTAEELARFEARNAFQAASESSE